MEDSRGAERHCASRSASSAVALALAIMVAVAWSTTPAVADERLNVLLITVDDMNQDSVGAFGCEVPGTTPNIDRLATEGLRFVHAHVTIAVCQPCRAVWMTGRYPHRNGALGFEPIRAGVPTLPETLKEAGYLTGLMAKVGHVLPSRKQAWDVVVGADRLGVGRDAALYGEHAEAFLEKAKSERKPFFLMANAQDPHRPFLGSAQERRRFRKRLEGRGTMAPVSRVFEPAEVSVPGFLPDLPAVRKEIAEYYSSVRRADDVVGALLEALQRSGLRDETVVLCLSDHGMALPFAKTNCYRHSTRTPLIVRWPGVIEPGSVDDRHLTGGVDLAPTILELLGLAPLQGIDGRSFLPLLRGEEQAGRDVVFTHFHRTAGKRDYPMRSVQDRRYGYIFNGWSDGKTAFRNESQSGLAMAAMRRGAETDPVLAERVRFFLYRVPEELYDYVDDPDARNNLIDDPAHREVARRLRTRLLGHLQATEDPLRDRFERFLAGKP